MFSMSKHEKLSKNKTEKNKIIGKATEGEMYLCGDIKNEAALHLFLL